MTIEKKKHGRPWTKIGIFQLWKEAHIRCLQEQEICGNEYNVKIRLRGYGFAVLKRLKEDFIKKKNESKRKKKFSRKNKKPKNKQNKEI